MLTLSTSRTRRRLLCVAGSLLVLYAPQVAAQSSTAGPTPTAYPEFVKFEATNHTGTPLLLWTIDQAYDAAFFDVLSWVGGSESKSIGRIAANSATTRYSFRVPTTTKQSGKVYYQVRLTTRRDSLTYSPVRTLGTSPATGPDGLRAARR